jgi:Family of unknown function (DUF5715)
MRRLAALAFILCLPTLAVAAPKHRKRKPVVVDNRVFVGTAESLISQNQAIDVMGLPRIRDDKQLHSLIGENALVPVTLNQFVTISPKLETKRRYVNPLVDEFLQELGQEYFTQFSKPIQVNSAVRTIKTQLSLIRWNRNAAPIHGEKASAHLAGVAVDLQRRGLTPEQIRFLQQKLLPFARAGMIIVEEELKEPCFHIVVTGNYPSPVPPDLPSALPVVDPLPLQQSEPEAPNDSDHL